DGDGARRAGARGRFGGAGAADAAAAGGDRADAGDGAGDAVGAGAGRAGGDGDRRAAPGGDGDRDGVRVRPDGQRPGVDALADAPNLFAPVAEYVDEVYRLAPLVGMDPAIVVAQSAHETGAWTSPWWTERHNPAGIGITGDPVENDQSHTWANGTDAARSH